jgi:hypothetical protein
MNKQQLLGSLERDREAAEASAEHDNVVANATLTIGGKVYGPREAMAAEVIAAMRGENRRAMWASNMLRRKP